MGGDATGGDAAGGAEPGSALRTLLERLYGGGGQRATVDLRGRVPPGHRLVDGFVAIPDAANPRFLVPALPGRATAASLGAHIGLRDPRARRRRRAVAGLARTGLLGSVVGQRLAVSVPEGWDAAVTARVAFSAHLRRALDRPDAVVGLGVPTVDAHYKPTLQLFDRTGRPLGFAKLGWTTSTGTMVDRETSALRRDPVPEPGASTVRVPPLLDAGEWDGSPYLLTAPLPPEVVRVADDDPERFAAARAVAGRLVERHLCDSDYWASVRRRGDRLERPDERRLVDRALGLLAAEKGGWAFGRWHGDWVPWNLARGGDGAWYAFDWEHSTDEAPWGFDPLHWAVTVPFLTGGRDLRDSVATASAELPRDLPTVRCPTLLVVAYLVELVLRQDALREPPRSPPELEGANGTTVAAHDDLYPGLLPALSWAIERA